MPQDDMSCVGEWTAAISHQLKTVLFYFHATYQTVCIAPAERKEKLFSLEYETCQILKAISCMPRNKNVKGIYLTIPGYNGNTVLFFLLTDGISWNV